MRSVSALALCGIAVAACSPPPTTHNVVLISIDSLRRDNLGVYGRRARFAPELEVSPEIDAFASESVVFDDAWSSTSWTLPAHLSLFSGLPDPLHGVESDSLRADPLHPLLAEQLSRAGARTAAFYSGPYLDPKYGFGRGFDHYESAMTPPDDKARELARRLEGQNLSAAEIEERVRRFRGHFSHVDRTSERVNRLALDFLEAERDRTFFLFLHYFDVHYDYRPPEDLARRFDPDYAGRMDGSRWWNRPDVLDRRVDPPKRRIGERDLAHVRALYDAEVHWVDRHVGEVLGRLRELGLWERTIVVLLSDHGDEFFEHGSIGHRSTLYPELAAIPLIVRVPGLAPSRVADSVRIYDVAPTLLDSLGLERPIAVGGRSLRPLLEGSADVPRAAYSRLTHDLGGGFGNHRDAWRDGRFTLARRFAPDGRRDANGRRRARPSAAGGRAALELYDRRSDPGELEAIGVADPRWSEALARFCAAHREQLREEASLPRSPADARRAPEHSDEEREMLVALGYAEASEAGASEPPTLPALAPFPPPCPRAPR